MRFCGPRLGRERLRNDGSRCKPVRDENPCVAWISAVSPSWNGHLGLTTDQEVGDSSSSRRAAESPARWGFRRVNPATVEDMTPHFWAASWSAVFGFACIARPTTGSQRDKGSRLDPAARVGFGDLWRVSSPSLVPPSEEVSGSLLPPTVGSAGSVPASASEEALARALPVSQKKPFVELVIASGAHNHWPTANDAGGLADSAFTNDPSFVFPEDAVILRPGRPLQRAEADLHRAFYEGMIPILGSIEAPGVIEDGDGCWLDATTPVVGRGFRTNQSGIDQPTAIVEPHGIAVGPWIRD